MPENQYHPDYVSNPGETIKETMQALGLSPRDLATRMDSPIDEVRLLIAGRWRIREKTARRLERALGVPASFWRERSRQYNQHQRRQYMKVLRQVRRAKAHGRPATLTTGQWRYAIRCFAGRCAYCEDAPYQVLDHYVPVAAGGGTTANNCVPACRACDARKGDLPPGEFVALFPPENIERIQAYFARVRAS